MLNATVWSIAIFVAAGATDACPQIQKKCWQASFKHQKMVSSIHGYYVHPFLTNFHFNCIQHLDLRLYDLAILALRIDYYFFLEFWSSEDKEAKVVLCSRSARVWSKEKNTCWSMQWNSVLAIWRMLAVTYKVDLFACSDFRPQVWP